jgi:hypothetical protein
MIKGLLILNSSYVGSRDLWWPDDLAAKGGYNVYRAFDRPEGWQKLNKYPLPIHFWRDQTELRRETFTVEAGNWKEDGELGHYIVKLPHTPYAKWGDDQRRVRAITTNSNQDVAVMFNQDGNWMRPARVIGLDREVWIKVDRTLPEGGAVSDFPVTPGLPEQSQTYTKPSGTTGPLEVTSVQVTYFTIDNFVDIFSTLIRTFYTVVPVGADGNELHKPGDPASEYVDSYQVDKMDYMQAEMVRRNQWLFEQVGEPSWLMFRRTKGKICGCVQTGTGQPRTACPACYETGIVGGYLGPVAMLYIDPDTAAVRTLNEGGVKVERDSRSYLGPTPIVQDGDMIVRRNGERLVVSGVTYKMPRGVILQQEFTTSLLPPGDTRYLIPVVQDTFPPTIYDPEKTPGFLDPRTGVFTPDPNQPPAGAEPVREINTQPGGDRQTGRTITFGRVQS